MAAGVPDSHRIAVRGVEFLAELGRGARTVVYRARVRGGEYAVKVLLGVGGERAIDEFRHEAALVASLRHPGLATVHEVGSVSGRPYLIMDLVPGAPLSTVLAGGALDEPRALRLGLEVADVLASAHRAGLVHRDVKPDNIMIKPDGGSCLLDFGLASRAGGVTDDGDAAVGTFRYSAPEQTGMLRRTVDGRADLYALGVVLYECLAGAAPFDAEDAGELIRLHLSAAPPDLAARRPDVSPALLDVVAALLAKDPDDRYQTASLLAADLRRIEAGTPERFPLSRDGTDPTALDGPDRGGTREPVGRADETDRLLTRWLSARAGAGGAALISGGAGIGKSTLLHQLARTARAGGHPVLLGAGTPGDPAPLAALATAMERYVNTVRRHAEPERSAALDRLRSAASGTGALTAALNPALADVLGVPPATGGDQQEQFAEAVALLLVGLARAEGGAVLALDDAQHLDAGTRRVLRHLGPLLADAPLLVIVAGRDEAVDGITGELGRTVDLRIEPEPLDRAAVAGLIEARLGPATVPDVLVDKLLARSGGNPLAVGDYLHVMIDHGLLWPSWGTWLLDEDRLDALALPDDVIGLLLRRLDALTDDERDILAVAAVAGTRFRGALVEEAGGLDHTAVWTALDAAVRHGLIEPVGDDEYLFLHEELRQVLRRGFDEARLRALHQGVAEALDRRRPADPIEIYQRARHYRAGDWSARPRATYDALAAAGSTALVQQEPADAIGYLTAAVQVAGHAGFGPDAVLLEDLGVAATRADRYDLALESLDAALEQQIDPVGRARLYGRKAEAYHLRWEAGLALDTVRQAYAALGAPIPTKPFPLLVSTLVRFVAGLLVSFLPAHLRDVAGSRREVDRTYCALSTIGAKSAAMSMQHELTGLLDMRAFLPANRLGPGREYALSRGGLAIMTAAMGLRAVSRRLLAQALAVSAPLDDPILTATVRWMAGMAHVTTEETGDDDTHPMARALNDHGRWLDSSFFLAGVAMMGSAWQLRGYPDRAAAWYQRSADRIPDRDALVGSGLGVLAIEIAALAGRPLDAVARRDEARARLARQPEMVLERANLAVATVQCAVELGEFDQLDQVYADAVAEFATLRLKTATMWTVHRALWRHYAFGCLARLKAASRADRAARLAAAQHAVRRLRRMAKGPTLRAFSTVAEASLCQLRGDHDGALRRLAGLADRLAGLDLPLLEFEILLVQARASQALGHARRAQRVAGMAELLAERHGWAYRLHLVRKEHGLTDHASGAARRGGSTTSLAGAPAMQQRRLKALHQVSLAASTVFDPEQLAGIALDEIVRIFGAERAFLFLVDADGSATAPERLTPFLGRDSEGHQIDELTGYGSTLVDRVRDTGEALVVTGSDEGAALGSQSAVVHGLRSIMVAPLILGTRLQGVVYLDSRAARGIFTTDDVEILTAITNQVASALETARAAQLEIAVRTAHRDRDIAQTLHIALADIGGTLDPDEVARRLVGTISRVLGIQRAVLLRGAPHTPVVAAAVPEDLAGDGDPANDPALAAALADTAVWYGPASIAHPAPAVLGPEVTSWLHAPVMVRDKRLGTLVLGATGGRPMSAADAELLTALAGQGALALENALLFSTVENLATTDGLTGLFNRRHFIDRADPVVDSRHRHGRPLAAIMVDVDHFKSVNDGYGHAVGDEVIREVSRRLSTTLRSDDLLCRYGGEEFAALLQDAGPAEALATAHRLHAAIGQQPVRTAAGPLPVTVSIGLSGPAADLPNLEAMLKSADEALYEAKRTGRDRVVAAGQPT